MKTSRRGELPFDRRAQVALVACPPPWEPVDPADHAFYRKLVARHGEELLEQALAQPESRSWLLVRYLPDVPAVLVEWSLESFRRESMRFCELVGGEPDVSAADAWEADWRRTHGKNGGKAR
jgi:hypothetical protein